MNFDLTRRHFLAAAATVTCLPHCLAARQPSTGVGLPTVDAMMAEFMQQHAVTGASLAITRKGRLVHAAGYGVADPATQSPVTPLHRFRIASVSKPLTAIAILRLCQQKQLQLSDRVVDVLQLKPTDARFAAITIDHLLHHSGGFDRNASFDPMFRDEEIAETQQLPLPVPQQAIVDYMLDRPLDFAPGSRYAYSNFGYLLLGQVIERLTKQTYEAFVQQQILHPCGERRMQLGQTARLRAAENEVVYVPDRPERTYPSVLTPEREPVAGPYGHFQLEPMAAHGGWLATASGLVRLAAALRGFVWPAPLSAGSLQTMLRKPDFIDNEQAVHYGCGVQVRSLKNGKHNLWHNGSLDGTNSLWVLRHDDLAWCVLFNQRYGCDRKQLSSLIDAPLHRAVDAVEDWPSEDLFERYL